MFQGRQILSLLPNIIRSNPVLLNTVSEPLPGGGSDKEPDHDGGGEGLGDQADVAGHLGLGQALQGLSPLNTQLPQLTQLVAVTQLPFTRNF